MKRDMDLARAILIALEETDSANKMQQFSIAGTSEETLSYHIKLRHQAGLIEAHDGSGVNEFKWYPISLTWDGHEFIEVAKNDTIWKKVASRLVEKTGGLSFAVLKKLLTENASELMK